MRNPGAVALFVYVLAVLAAAAPAGARCAASGGTTAPSLAITRKPGPPPAGVADLKFQDLFKLPVGARGLEPSEKLRALDGKRVRIIGYMVRQPEAPAGSFLLSPLPAAVSDEDEPLADDMPASTIAVTVPGVTQKPIEWIPGLIQATGVLHVGARSDAPSGRVCPVQITLDPAWAHRLLGHRRGSAASGIRPASEHQLPPRR